MLNPGQFQSLGHSICFAVPITARYSSEDFFVHCRLPEIVVMRLFTTSILSEHGCLLQVYNSG